RNVFSPLGSSYAASTIDRAPRFQSDTYEVERLVGAKLRVDAETRQTWQPIREDRAGCSFLKVDHNLIQISASLFFSSIILYHSSIAFGLLLFSVLVELGTWYAGRCNLIYHHY
ncbi:hypothetical protein N7519_005459, partial [Penicillium mononematosum]|uniref:uncharacterized protein n=1 Tax=Penicillium mononematosum TaxID=268346 RepID=UPI0025495BC7